MHDVRMCLGYTKATMTDVLSVAFTPTDEVKGGQTRSKITPRCNERVQAKFRLHDILLYLGYTKTPMTDVLAVAFTPTDEVK